MKPVTFPDRAGNSSRIDRFTDSTRDGLKSGDAAARLEHPTGRRIPAARIAEALKRHDADIVVLSEYRGGTSAPRLCAALHALGYRHATTLVPPPSRNGVLVAHGAPFANTAP